MPDTGWTLPGSAFTEGTGTDWTNPQNITDSSSNSADINPKTNAVAKKLCAHNFSFQIPTSAQVTGIDVRILISCAWYYGNSPRAEIDGFQLFELTGPSNITLIGNSQKPSGRIQQDPGYLSIETSNNLWALSPSQRTPSFVNQNSFGVALAISFSQTVPDVKVRNIELRIHYQELGNTYTRDSGVWKLGQAHVRDAGVWKGGLTYVRDGGIWKS